ncbi:hemerythrin domain-containing protein [Nocardioides terrisoli]|uniref:hemerythrin domain-containing protein n=1 Tax=Nocardioides terrisoli TaxID=3388267 RepID=UPI00287B8919|nr:hemerythrin domain-containing protein [Nocardioides marmorisolisilvae]
MAEPSTHQPDIGVPGPGALRAALEREHRAIDGGVEDFLAGAGGLDQAERRLREALTALRRHIYLEEEFLFPPMRSSGLLAPVFVMLSEHRDLWRTMDLLEAQLDGAGLDGAGLDGAQLDGVVDASRQTAATLLAQLDRHNTKEEPIIYGAADTTLTEDARAELADFISHEQLPAGWTCQGA